MAKNVDTPVALASGLDAAAKGLVGAGDDAWIEVIQQMDRVYGELVESQVALEQKNEELENAQEFIASVMEAMTDLMIVCDRDGCIQQVNSALETLTGIAAGELTGLPLSFVLQGGGADTQTEFLTRLQANRPFFDCEVLVKNAQGEQVPISVNCSPRHDHRNRSVGMVLIGRPVGELQHAYRELDDALKNFENAQQHLVSSEKMSALGRLVAGVAHELNNPISFVFGNMHALKSYGEKITRFLEATDQDLTHDEMLRLRHDLQIDRIAKDILPLVEGTLEGAERVSDIVQDLRRFSGNQKEPVDEFALRGLIETAVNWVMRGTKAVPQVHIDCPETLYVTTKKGHVHQILVNLVQNAVDALAGVDNPQMVIRALMQEGQVCLSISDNGSGIAADHLGKIFEPFYTTKPVGKGTGLGLYVSYRMAEEIGGSLAAENLLQGACFKLQLPETPPETLS